MIAAFRRVMLTGPHGRRHAHLRRRRHRAAVEDEIQETFAEVYDTAGGTEGGVRENFLIVINRANSPNSHVRSNISYANYHTIWLYYRLYPQPQESSIRKVLPHSRNPIVNENILPQIQSWLDFHIDGFAASGDGVREMLDLKREHSAFVAGHCRDIAAELGWNARDIEVAEAAGLLHDAGRFSQFAEFGTFVDASSVDHGVRGREIVAGSEALARFDDRERARILDSILLHNRRDIPPDTALDALPLVKLVRDADKLDIYRIVTARMDAGRFRDHLKLALGIGEEAPSNPDAAGDVFSRRTVANEHIRSLDDFLLMQLSWVFDINYRPTLRRIVEREYLDRIARELTEDSARSASRFLLDEAAASVGAVS
jgi:hypothetical protein